MYFFFDCDLVVRFSQEEVRLMVRLTKRFGDKMPKNRTGYDTTD